MSGPAHHQGSSSFSRYKRNMAVKEKRHVSDLAAYIASRNGPQNGVLCNDRAQQILDKYTKIAKEKHGSDFDVMNEPFDPEVVYKVGCGKKHGHHCLGNGYIDSRVSTSQSRSSTSCGSFEEMRPSRRIKTAVDRIGDLESKMEEMRQMLISLTQNQNRITNNGIAVAATPASTPGTAASVGNNTTTNFNNPQQEHVDECVNYDVVM